jgi:hypothetical protein
MPKCVTCDKFFHPDFSVIVDEATTACKCVFCYTEKGEVTIQEEDGKPSYTINKAEAIERYRVYIGQLKDDPKVSKVLTGNAKSKFSI